jgi:hypothetical protein
MINDREDAVKYASGLSETIFYSIFFTRYADKGAGGAFSA